MTSQRRIHPARRLQPDVYFLPLELHAPRQVRGLDVEMVRRRIPDCLHHLINNGAAVPTGTVQPQPPPLEEVRAVVTGTLDVSHEGFELELQIHFRPDPEPIRSMTLSVPVSLRKPMPALARLAARLAGILEIPLPPATGLTDNTQAFYRFLAGLDGSVPLSEALALDPGFGLALRVVHARLFAAMEEDRLDLRACRRLLDDCLAARPTDGEACSWVAELLQRLGEEERTLAWLEHAVRLPGPSARALEVLGSLLARRGDQGRARTLWQRGADLHGHPDFSAHLARLAFEEGDVPAAWAEGARGLRRIRERLARRQEWPMDRRHMAGLLGWFARVTGLHQPPEEIRGLLCDLRGCLPYPEERVELGRCLLELGLVADARAEVQSALAMDLAVETRDRAVRVMLALDVAGFEGRLRAAVDAIQDGDPASGMGAMGEFLLRQPEFWPALFYLAIGFKRQGREDEALDALAEVLQMRPGHVETLVEMADLFARRGNPKRALECVDEALENRGLAELHLRRADYLEQLDRAHEAAAAVDRALELRKATGVSA